MSGWQKATDGIWHYYPRGPFLFLSACEEVRHSDEPLLVEPTSQIMTCPLCVAGMRKIVGLLEKRYNRPHAQTAD